MHHGVEGKTNPTQGQAVTKSNQIPRGRDQRKSWARTPTARGREATTGRGREPTTAKHRTDTERPNHLQKGARRPRKDTGRNTNTPKTPPKRGPRTRGSETQDQGQKTAGRAQPKSRPHQTTQPNKQKGDQAGNGTPRRHAKRRLPHRSKWEQIAMWCRLYCQGMF